MEMKYSIQPQHNLPGILVQWNALFNQTKNAAAIKMHHNGVWTTVERIKRLKSTKRICQMLTFVHNRN